MADDVLRQQPTNYNEVSLLRFSKNLRYIAIKLRNYNFYNLGKNKMKKNNKENLIKESEPPTEAPVATPAATAAGASTSDKTTVAGGSADKENQEGAAAAYGGDELEFDKKKKRAAECQQQGGVKTRQKLHRSLGSGEKATNNSIGNQSINSVSKSIFYPFFVCRLLLQAATPSSHETTTGTQATEIELSRAYRERQRPAKCCDIATCIRACVPKNGRRLCCNNQVLQNRVAPNALRKCHLFNLPGKDESTLVKEAWNRIMTSSTTDETPADLDRTIASLAELMSKNKMDKLMKFFKHVDDDDEKTAACKSVQQESAE